LSLFVYGYRGRSKLYMATRIVVRIEITPNAKKALEDLGDKSGMTQVALTSRIIEWFANQSELVQAAILGHYPPEIQADIAKLIIKRMASMKKD
jgi:hypothetical protein